MRGVDSGPPGRAWIGNLALEFSSAGARLDAPALAGTPIYQGGMDQGDLLLTIDDQTVSSEDRLHAVLKQRKPGDEVRITFLQRGTRVTRTMTLQESPWVQLVPVEETGRPLTSAEREFRQRWLGR